MTREDLSFVADALLELCQKPSDRPYYTEHGMAARLKLAERRDPLAQSIEVLRPEDPLLRAECHEVFRQAKLTDRQAQVLAKRLEGWTFEEIGQAAGHSKQSVQHVFVLALKKIVRTFRVYPFKGLSDVYRSEVRRGLTRTRTGKILRPAA
jgi:hypothetical protein